MRRNARWNQHGEDYAVSTLPLHNILLNDSPPNEDLLRMNVMSHEPDICNNNKHRFENTIEAKVEIGDTLQAIALRFHCSVADIRRLNKIDKDNEIHARKVVKIPVTIHNVLLDNLPIVHKSGNNSPKEGNKHADNEIRGSNTGLSSMLRNPLQDAEAMLSEKLMVASVNSSRLDKHHYTGKAELAVDNSTNNTILCSKMSDNVHKCTDEDEHLNRDHDGILKPLLADLLDDSTTHPQLHRIRGPSFRTMDWSGSDCDMSWICLFVFILALCFVIPLVYVFYIAEHSHHNSTFQH